MDYKLLLPIISILDIPHSLVLFSKFEIQLCITGKPGLLWDFYFISWMPSEDYKYILLKLILEYTNCFRSATVTKKLILGNN